MTDERLKMWLDLVKWAVVSVGLVVMTQIIDAGFKDREVGINEIKEYDKYVSLVTNNNKISERRLLAQYFAYITPSKKLREGWNNYYNIVDKEYQKLDAEKRKKEEKLALLDTVGGAPGSAKDEAISRLLTMQLKEINTELTPTFDKLKGFSNVEDALSWERVGFEMLLSDSPDQAIAAFESAEESYNGYHQVYEIAEYLKKEQDSDKEQNEQFWSDIYKKIYTDFNWKMPADVKERLTQKSGQ